MPGHVEREIEPGFDTPHTPVDETPLGTFVELEGADAGTRAESEQRRVEPGDMLFAEE